MKSPFALQKTLSLLSLLSAGTLAPTVVCAEPITVSTEEELRKNLTDSTVDGAEIKVGSAITVTTFDTETNTANPISILAKKVTLTGETISPQNYEASEIPLETNLNLFTLSANEVFLTSLKLSVDTPKETGRFFLLDNIATLNLGENVTFSNGSHSADSTTPYGARGGAILSTHILDEISIGAGTNEFISNAIKDKSSADAENSGAFGGAIYASGLVSVDELSNLTFKENSAISDNNDASGGAIFISNAKLESTGPSSSVTYPDSVTDTTGTQKYGLQVAGTVNFSSNKVEGKNASGGAVFVSGGYFDATGTATISFEKNSASSTAGGSSLAGGALAIGDSGRATFSENTTLTFSENSLAGTSGEKTKAAGGALAVMDADFSSTGTLTFSSNTVAGCSGSTLSGGAAYFYGTEETIKNSDGTTTVGNTTNITLAGTVSFASNKVAFTSSDDSSTASGGAIYVSGAKIDGSNLSEIKFESNTVEVGVGTAQGGAIAIEGESADVSLSASQDIVFSKNSATVKEMTPNGTALGGAIFQSAGTLSLGKTDSKTNFSENSAEASTKSSTALGGAIYLSGGNQTFAGEVNFSSNNANAICDELGSATAFGGAIYVSGGTQTFQQHAIFVYNTACVSAAKEQLVSGGALYQASTAGKILFERRVFISNSLTASTGSTYLSGAQGGAIYSSGEIEMRSGNFMKNSATAKTARGGAIYLSGGSLSVDEYLHVGNNSASGSSSALGGAIFIDSASTVSTWILDAGSNSATASDTKGVAQGGAIYTAGTLTTNGIVAESNRVCASGSEGTAQGGAIYIAGGNVSLTSATFTSNTATATSGSGTAQGGAIYIAGGNVSLTNATFTSNTATATSGSGTAQGGALYIAGGNVSLTNATFTSNTATEGGAIYINSSRASTLKFLGETQIGVAGDANKGKDDIYIGSGTEAVTIEFSQESGQRAEIFSEIKGATDASSLVLKKTGEGWLSVHGNVSAQKLSIVCDGGITKFEGEVSSDVDISVAAGAELYDIGSGIKDVASMNIAGTVYVENASDFELKDGSKTEISATGTLSFKGSTVNISGSSTVSGDGSFSVKGTTIKFSGGDEAEADLSVKNLSVGAGKLTLENQSSTASTAGKLSVSDSLTFTETGSAEIVIGENTELSLTTVERTAKDVDVTISGAGTLSGTSSDAYVNLSAYYETDADGNLTGNAIAGTFSVAKDVKISTGISVGDGVTLSLARGSQISGSKKITLAGGTLLASDTTSAEPFELEAFSVEAGGLSTLGACGDPSNYQHFKMVATGTGENASEAVAKISGTLKISEYTNFYGNIELSSGAALSGQGMVEGDIYGSGTISGITVNGEISAKNGYSITLTGERDQYIDRISIGDEDSYGNARLVVSAGENDLTIHTKEVSNYGGRMTVSGRVAYFPLTLEGNLNFSNGGTLVVSENSTLKISTNFKNYIDLSDGTSREGTIDLSATGSQLVFNTVGSVIDLSRGEILIDATTLPANSYLPIEGLTDGNRTLNIVDASGYDLANRFEWDGKHWVFLGLNGEAFRGTIFGDWQRESVNRTHEFLRTALFRGNSRPLAPEIYGANKKTSPYMRGYLDKMSRRGADVSAEIEAKNKEESARAEKLNSPLKNVWAQADYASRERKSDGDFVAYDSTIASVLAGFSLPVGKNWELGATIFGSTEKYETNDAETTHKITTDSYGLAGYARYKNEWFDWSAGATGAVDFSDSDRGEYSGSFDGARLGAMTEFGATLRVRSSVALRAFAGISLAYSQNDSFDESGAGGNGALSIDSSDVFGTRTNLGISSAFMVTDALQLGVRLAWLLDLGKDTYSLDAYMPGTRTDYVIDSRENNTSALDAGAYFNWAVADEVEIFGGYTGTFRSGETAHGFTLGVNCFF